MSLPPIAIIGAGRVGLTLADRFLAAGARVTIGTRDASKPEIRTLLDRYPERAIAADGATAAASATVVVVATPSAAVESAVSALGALGDRIVVDATNPVGPGLTHALATGSNAERIAAVLPGVRVVKAFNTIGAEVMAHPALALGAAALLIAGDDAEAKGVVASMAEAIGFAPLDAGPLVRARSLEHVALVWIGLSGSQGRGFGFVRSDPIG
jgi:predicted dinucleotide-binding enzyme